MATDDFRSRDPVLRLLPEEVPDAFRKLPYDEQRIRGRWFLMVWTMYRDIPYSWFHALATEAEHTKSMHETIKTVDDGLILAAVRAANADEGVESVTVQ